MSKRTIAKGFFTLHQLANVDLQTSQNLLHRQFHHQLSLIFKTGNFSKFNIPTSHRRLHIDPLKRTFVKNQDLDLIVTSKNDFYFFLPL